MWQVLGIVFIAGCAGGLVNGLMSGQVVMPFYRKQCRTYFPGILGNVLLGGMGAIVFWGLYGPLANVNLVTLSETESTIPKLVLSLGDLLGSVVVGISGGRMLSSEAERRCLKNRMNEPAHTSQ